MTLAMWVTLGILAAAIMLFVTEWLRVDVVALCVVAALMLTNLLTPSEALAGFSNPAVLAIAALFVVGEAVLQTGLAGALGQRLLGLAGGSPVRLTVVLMLVVGVCSSFISSTGTVAVLLPVVLVLARGARLSPSQLLIPLAYGALLGGALTLIGTPSNLIVSDLLRASGQPAFTFFSFTPIGALLLLAGVAFMATIGRRLLPDRRARVEPQPVETPRELIELYELAGNLFRLRVRRDSELAGQTLAASRLRQDFGINVLEILRPVEARPGLSFARLRGAAPVQRASLTPDAATELQAQDVLIAQGDGNAVGRAAARWNLAVQPAAGDDAALAGDEAGIAEVILPPRSGLAGKTLVATRFGRAFGLTVLGLNRPGANAQPNLKTTPLRPGDVLLVQGPWKHVAGLKQRPRDFVVVGQPETLAGPPHRDKALIAVLIVAAMLGIMITDLLPVATASMLAALALVLTGCLTIDDAYHAIDWRSIMLIAGMLPMSTALEKTALVDAAAGFLVQWLGAWGPVAMMAGLFLATTVFTQVLSNTATTVLVAPVALAAAAALGVRPQAFVMAVAIAASMAFCTPVASPVNTLVMGAGGYRFGDYARVGVPLTLITMLIAVLVLPWLWSF